MKAELEAAQKKFDDAEALRLQAQLQAQKPVKKVVLKKVPQRPIAHEARGNEGIPVVPFSLPSKQISDLTIVTFGSR
jgi:hypothetical protein